MTCEHWSYGLTPNKKKLIGLLKADQLGIFACMKNTASAAKSNLEIGGPYCGNLSGLTEPISIKCDHARAKKSWHKMKMNGDRGFPQRRPAVGSNVFDKLSFRRTRYLIEATQNIIRLIHCCAKPKLSKVLIMKSHRRRSYALEKSVLTNTHPFFPPELCRRF